MTRTPFIGALHGAAAALPHLAGLARLVELETDSRVATAGICASGRLLINPHWFGDLTFSDRVFVVAHELMHLALRSHDRCRGGDARLFNVAHDFIINDMLSVALDQRVPAQGLCRPGAATTSAERIVVELKREEQRGVPAPLSPWRGAVARLGTLGVALVDAGLGGPLPPPLVADVIDAATEQRLFPGQPCDPARLARLRSAGERALALGVSMKKARAAFDVIGTVPTPETATQQGAWDLLDTYRAPPWETALQRWLDDMAPAGRSYSRCSRRQGDRADVVLAGRQRDGWTLNVVLDTSGSMLASDDDGPSPLQSALGSIKSFCVAANVGRVRLVQGGTHVDADDIIDVRHMDRHRIVGGGSSDLSPSLRLLADDPQVAAVIVITDGDICYPEDVMPYDVLWAVTAEAGFLPPYGRVVSLDPTARWRANAIPTG